MDFELAVWPGELEIRRVGGGRRLSGSFPYSTRNRPSRATVRDRGTVRKEAFAPGAFSYTLNVDTEAKVDLLIAHSFDRPIASRQLGTLTLVDTPEALTFEAELPADPPSWVTDVEKAIAAGLQTGISPGFHVPPRGVVPNGERLIPEPGNPGVMIRQINHAVLRELSVVTNAAYDDSFVELRSETGANAIILPRAATLWL